MKQIKIGWVEAQEIAEAILKIENNDDDTSLVEEALAEKWGIGLDTFQEIAQALCNMINFSVSPLTQTPMVGISTGNTWLVKKDVDQQFINGVIEWATEGEEIEEGKKGFIRTITLNGKPEFDITISRPKADVEAVS